MIDVFIQGRVKEEIAFSTTELQLIIIELIININWLIIDNFQKVLRRVQAAREAADAAQGSPGLFRSVGRGGGGGGRRVRGGGGGSGGRGGGGG